MPPSSQAAYQSLQDYDKTRVSPQAAIDQGEQRYGVSGLGSQVASLRAMTGNLEQSIKNVDPSVTGRTQGSLVTEAARQRIVNQERSPLMDQFGTASRSLADTGDQYNRATGLATNYANGLMQDDKNTYDRLFGQYQTLSQQEQAAAQAAEQRRQFDMTLTEQQAARKDAAARAAASASGSSGFDIASLRKFLDQYAGTAGQPGGPSQAQVNAAMTLKSLGGAPDPNYTSKTSDIGKLGLNDKKMSYVPGWMKKWLGL